MALRLELHTLLQTKSALEQCWIGTVSLEEIQGLLVLRPASSFWQNLWLWNCVVETVMCSSLCVSSPVQELSTSRKRIWWQSQVTQSCLSWCGTSAFQSSWVKDSLGPSFSACSLQQQHRTSFLGVAVKWKRCPFLHLLETYLQHQIALSRMRNADVLPLLGDCSWTGSFGERALFVPGYTSLKFQPSLAGRRKEREEVSRFWFRYYIVLLFFPSFRFS